MQTPAWRLRNQRRSPKSSRQSLECYWLEKLSGRVNLKCPTQFMRVLGKEFIHPDVPPPG